MNNLIVKIPPIETNWGTKKEKQWYDPFKSEEEFYFNEFCKEMKEEGFIDEFWYEPFSILVSQKYTYEATEFLKTKSKKVERKLLDSHYYTPDFLISWSPKGGMPLTLNLDDSYYSFKNYFKSSDTALPLPFVGENGFTFIDVKPSFDQHNMTRLFSLNQKWIYEKYKIYVQKIIVKAPAPKSGKGKKFLFRDLWTPKSFLSTATGKKRKIWWEVRTIKEWKKERGLY